MKCWKIISFTTEPQITTNNPVTLVPFKTLVHTLPLAISYLLYMVGIVWIIFHIFWLDIIYEFPSNDGYL